MYLFICSTLEYQNNNKNMLSVKKKPSDQNSACFEGIGLNFVSSELQRVPTFVWNMVWSTCQCFISLSIPVLICWSSSASMELQMPWVAVRFGEALLPTLPLQLLVWQSRNTPCLCIVQVFTGVSTDSWHLLGPGWLLVWSSLTVDSMNQAPYEGNMAVCPLGLYSGSSHVYDPIGAVLSELL